MITVSEEKGVDYETTARIATEAFGSKEVVFSAERMKWVYERSFGQGTTVLAVLDDGVKIGQIALVHQMICLDDEPGAPTNLVDLFILKPYPPPPLFPCIFNAFTRP